jgi:CubicO group peptidase (beta-lactamase class C family)
MSTRIRFAVVCLIVVCAGALCAQTKAEKIDALLHKYAEYGQFNGSMLVADGGVVLLKNGYGMANFEWDIPNAPDTKFRLGSITKQFTSMLVMQQVEKGKITLDDPVARYLPDYPKPQADKVTIRHLLTHTSGTPNYTENRELMRDRSSYPLEKLVAAFSSLPLEFEPGTQWKYSNSGYVVLGAILEKVTGMPYEQALQEGILGPLGMKNSGYDHSEPIIKKRASGYDKQDRMMNTRFLDMSVPFSAGALYSTVEDLFLWDRALYTERLISEKSKAEYFKPFLRHYAFGWGVSYAKVGESSDSVLAISHGGGINGFNTLIMRVPARQQLIVLLNNTGGTALDDMAKGILGILYDKPFAAPRQSLSDRLAVLIKDKGMTGALATFRELKARTTEYYMSEAEINQLGYTLMQSGKAREAIEVFKLNVEAFPKSWNVYDSLGEAYMTDGQKALAIENYEKSVQMNPANSGGVDALKKLRMKN